MSETNIEVKIGKFSFSGSGNQDWLEKQLDKIIDKAEKIGSLVNDMSHQANSPAVNQNSQFSDVMDYSETSEFANKALATVLNDKNATKNQNNKFLVTAIWLHSKGQKRLTTRDVSSALKNASQTKINNPSLSLSQNLTKGYCEKDGGSEFFVTEDGKKAMGIT